MMIIGTVFIGGKYIFDFFLHSNNADIKLMFQAGNSLFYLKKIEYGRTEIHTKKFFFKVRVFKKAKLSIFQDKRYIYIRI